MDRRVKTTYPPAMRGKGVNWGEWASFGLCLLLGGVIGAAFLGFDRLDPRRTAWIGGDAALYFGAFDAYRTEPNLLFPLGRTDRLGAPAGAALAVFDALPLIAWILRFFSDFLPRPMQYFGVLACLNLGLTAWFARLCLKRLNPDNQALVWAGTVLLALAPPQLNKLMVGHFNVSAHWVILACLYVHLKIGNARPSAENARPTPENGVSGRGLAIGLACLLVFTGGVNPYLAVLALGGVCAICVRLLLVKRVRPLGFVLLCVAAVGIVLGTWFLFGFIGGPASAAHRAGGFGLGGLNLNALFNPMGEGGFLPPRPLWNINQFEGFAYLGAAGIAVLLIGASGLSVRRLRKTVDLWLPLVFAGGLFFVLSLADKVSFDGRILAGIPLPGRWVDAASAFRVSARFFWPVYYGLLLFAVHGFGLRLGRFAPALLAVLCLVQAVELHRLFSARKEPLPAPSPLMDARWGELSGRVETLYVLPNWQCDQRRTPGGHDGFRWFGRVAADQRLNLNSFYFGRFSPANSRLHCELVPGEALAGNLAPNAAYVFSDALLALAARSSPKSHACERVDGFNLCLPDAPGREFAPFAHGLFPTLAPGELVRYGRGGQGAALLLNGFEHPRPEGVYTRSGPASLALPTAPDPAWTGDRMLDLTLQAQVAPRDPARRVEITLNGRTLGRLTLTESGPVAFSFRAPPRPEHGFEYLDILVENPSSGKALGVSADERVRGVLLVESRLSPWDAPPAPLP